jgi:WD40 repeat protein
VSPPELVPETGFRGAIAWHPKGRAFLVATGKKLRELSAKGGAGKTLELARPVSAIAYSFEGERIAVVDDEATLHVYRSGDLGVVAELPPPGTPDPPVNGEPSRPEVHAVTFAPGGKLVATSTQRATQSIPTVAVYDVEAKKPRCTVDDVFAFDLAFTASAAELVVTGVGAMARVDATTCKSLASGSAETGGTFGSWVAPLGGHVAAADAAGHAVGLYDTKSFQKVGVLAQSAGCSDHVGPIWFSRDGEIMMATGSGVWLRTFRVDSMKSIAAYDIPSPDGTDLLPFDDGERVLIVRGDKAELVSAVSKTVAFTIETNGATRFSHSWDMKHLLGVGPKEARIWDAATGKLESTQPLAP